MKQGWCTHSRRLLGQDIIHVASSCKHESPGIGLHSFILLRHLRKGSEGVIGRTCPVFELLNVAQ